MLERVPTILTGQEMLDKAFQRAAKIDVPDPVRYHRIRKTEAAKMQSIADTLSENLLSFHRAFPNLDHERHYDVAVLDIVTGLHKLRKALGSVLWGAEKVQDVHREAMQRMSQERTLEGIKAAQKKFYGRASSILYEMDKSLEVLRHTREACKQLPTVSPDYATIVIAGYPNVGKTSLLRQWTDSRAEINHYAFTTKHAEVGHFVLDRAGVHEQFQVVDTPGLLDRPDTERNAVEQQALAALRLAADAVMFLIDPSETCGYSLEAQEHLLEQVKRDMTGVPMLVAESKRDMVAGDPTRPGFSTLTGDGVEELREQVMALLLEAQQMTEDLDEDPLDRWRALGAQE